MPLRIVISEDKLQETFLEACKLMQKMRFHRKRFEFTHDAEQKKTMKAWEERADLFLASLQTEPEEVHTSKNVE
jgi:hypothetical protein